MCALLLPPWRTWRVATITGLILVHGTVAPRVARYHARHRRHSGRAQNRQRRVELQERIKRNQEALAVAKREDVRAERSVKLENAQMVRSLKEFDAARAAKGRAEIRAHQKDVSAKFEKQRQAHQEFLAQDFINMIALEDRKREEIEVEIAKMEEDERKHIEHLKALQEEQKMAYDALEAALSHRE